MTPDKLISDIHFLLPMLFHLIISIFGIILVISGIINFNERTSFIYTDALPIGPLGIILGLVLMYFGEAFSFIGELLNG